MLHDISIRCSNLSKTYVLRENRIRAILADFLLPKKTKKYILGQVDALKNINFEVKKGEVFGILGLNGAGKSTLLGCLSGIIAYDSGTLEINGKINALLRLGVGFHPYLTGRENVIIGCIAMGKSVEEALDSVPEIIEFAELEQFAHLPFYTYSSGMQARLQFSVAVRFTPDILVIDEALSTGDSYFVKKSMRRMEDICSGGSTVILVTHSTSIVESLCQRAMVLEKGEIIDSGAALEVGTRYRKHCADKTLESKRGSQERLKVADIGTGEIAIQSMAVQGSNESIVYWNQTVKFFIKIVANTRIENPRFCFQIFTMRESTLVCSIGNSMIDAESENLIHKELGDLYGEHTLEFEMPKCQLASNMYYVSFGIMRRSPQHKIENEEDYYVFRSRGLSFRAESFPHIPSMVGRTVVIEPPVKLRVLCDG